MGERLKRPPLPAVEPQRQVCGERDAARQGVVGDWRFPVGTVIQATGHLVALQISERAIDAATLFPTYIARDSVGREYLLDEWRAAPWGLDGANPFGRKGRGRK